MYLSLNIQINIIDDINHDDCSISVPFYGHCTGTLRQPCHSREGAVRLSQEPTVIVRFFLFRNGQLKPCVFNTIAVRPPCGARTGIVRCSYDVSTVYGLTIFIFLYNSELNKIEEATATLLRPKTVRYRTAFLRRPHDNWNLGIVRSS